MQLSPAAPSSVAASPATDRVAVAKLIGDAIRDLAAMRRTIERELVCDASVASLSVLSVLDRAGPLHVSEVAAQLDVDLSVASRHTSALERRGLVVRHPSPTDRRAHVVSLTEAGAETLARARGWLAERLEASLESWSLDRLHTLADALAELRSDLATFMPHTPSTIGEDTR
jgi:DNA-binding MarR family transcriptional regulator